MNKFDRAGFDGGRGGGEIAGDGITVARLPERIVARAWMSRRLTAQVTDRFVALGEATAR